MGGTELASKRKQLLSGPLRNRPGTGRGGATGLKLQVAVEIRCRLWLEGNLSFRLICSRQLVAALVHNAYHIIARI